MKNDRMRRQKGVLEGRCEDWGEWQMSGWMSRCIDNWEDERMDKKKTKPRGTKLNLEAW